MKRLLTLVVAILLAALGSSFEQGAANSAVPGAPGVIDLSTPTVKGGQVTLGPSLLRASEVRGPLDLSNGVALSAAGGGTFTSSIVRSPLPFSHVGIRFSGNVPPGSSVSWEVRGSVDGVSWTDWYPVDEDDDLPTSVDGQMTTRVFGLNRPDGRLSQFAQARATLNSSPSGARPSISSVTLAFIDPTPGPATAQAVQASRTSALGISPLAVSKPPVISRTAWGSPDGQGSPAWPPEYKTVTDMIIHHTVTSNTAIDWAAEVRAIWYYHAVTKGWGDIGYNFLIDPNGYIYEGRAGGDDVIGGHALQYNPGSMGVALLGTYSSVYPTGAAQNSLVNILSWKANQRGIDPMTLNSWFVDKYLPTIMGHRDAIYTSCPGDDAYSIIPQVRTAVRDRVGAQQVSAQILSTTFEPTVLYGGNLLKVTSVVRNNGNTTIHTQGPAPGFVYNEGEDFRKYAVESYGRFRVGVDLNGRSQSVDHPYRWGLGKDLAPGDSATVVGYIRLNSQSTTNYWAGLVDEAVGWVGDNLGSATVRVLPPDTTPPTVTVSMPASTLKTWVVIDWTATDSQSGVAPGFDVDYSSDQVNWVPWLRGASGPSALFANGVPEGKYYFRVTARDNVGNPGQGLGQVQLGKDPSGLTTIRMPLVFKNAQGGW
ncbi:MAG: N-acetylmuramoyl-L-alanine amidase [Chloroflexi bacterium]|nr:N-acetylmuramoyl-L-alanine amidase [Chloroflexota bacterium]